MEAIEEKWLRDFEDLLRSKRGFCEAVSMWTGQGSPHIEILKESQRPLTLPEYKALDGRANNSCYARSGLLRTGVPRQRTAAWTTATVLPDRLPAIVRARTGIPHADNFAYNGLREPLGKVLAEYGSRSYRETDVQQILGSYEATGEPLAFRCVGVWYLDNDPVAQVEEEIFLELITDFIPKEDR